MEAQHFRSGTIAISVVISSDDRSVDCSGEWQITTLMQICYLEFVERVISNGFCRSAEAVQS